MQMQHQTFHIKQGMFIPPAHWDGKLPSSATFRRLMQKSIDDDLNSIHALEKLVETYAWSGWMNQNTDEVKTVVLDALSSSRLSDAQSVALRLGEDSWNAPIFRVCLLCLRLCATGAFKIPSTLRKLGGQVVRWITLLCRTRIISQIDQGAKEDLIALFAIVSAQQDGLAIITENDPLAFHAFPSLMVTTFSHQVHKFTEQAYLYAYNLLSSILQAYYLKPSRVVIEDESVVAAMLAHPKETADFFMHTWRWAFGVLVGPGTGSVRRHAFFQLQCVPLLTSLPDIRRHLVECGFIASMCITARKIVRGEVEGPSNVFTILSIILNFLVNQVNRPKHMREALDAHIISTILRIPDMSSSIATDIHMSVPLEKSCFGFMTKCMTYTLFPTLRSSFKRSIVRVDELVDRGAITWRADNCSRIQRMYLRCMMAVSEPNRYDGWNKIPCSNSKSCKSTTIIGECARCEVAKYCSVACQKSHWKTSHKTTCGIIQALKKSSCGDLAPLDLFDNVALHFACKRAILSSMESDTSLKPRLRSLFDSRDMFTGPSVRDTPTVLINLWPSGSQMLSVPVECEHDISIVRCSALLASLDNIRNMKSGDGEGSVLETVEALRAGGPPVALMAGDWMGMITPLGQLLSDSPSFEVEIRARPVD
ncbi:hypothetical protein CYLTODRAFT_447526 [Cylindrobasidium torrendii FP15055 ss-10]|uniref:MYND-type domain-containing protein n=1 Tax=Cylindrobasidium torrendii FP15055 ss-10 TaxID=1314674 RepID=A0A0D7AUD2_9AGAR|nr:hypothetical protein CYLTODRAFT_447526 [Cylindrobasidium torrendii FP15055 ss-10]